MHILLWVMLGGCIGITVYLSIWTVSPKLYRTDRFVDSVFKHFIDNDFTVLEYDSYRFTVKSDKFVVRAWNESKPYAWLHSGIIIKVSNSKETREWEKRMPSRRTARLFKKKLEVKLDDFNNEWVV